MVQVAELALGVSGMALRASRALYKAATCWLRLAVLNLQDLAYDVVLALDRPVYGRVILLFMKGGQCRCEGPAKGSVLHCDWSRLVELGLKLGCTRSRVW